MESAFMRIFMTRKVSRREGNPTTEIQMLRRRKRYLGRPGKRWGDQNIEPQQAKQPIA
jgi:hypothetical protein